MGGRGSSYNRSILPPTPVMVAAVDDDDDQDDQQQIQAQSDGKPMSLSDFANMTDDEMTDVYNKAQQAALPSNLYDSPTQRLIHYLGINDTMESATDSELRQAVKAGATALYRTVNHNTQQNLTSAQIADDHRSGAVFNIGGTGGTAYGGGLYFSDDFKGSKMYGRPYLGPVNTIAAVFNSKAKGITGYDLSLKATAFLKSHPKFAKAIGVDTSQTRMGGRTWLSNRESSLVAMAMGYNYTKHSVGGGENYYVILDRSIVSASTTNFWDKRRGIK